MKHQSTNGVLVLIMAGALVFSSCSDNWPCINGSGPTVTVSRSISGFTGVRNEIDANVYITQGAAYSVELEGQQNVLDNITTHVSGGELQIKSDHCINNSETIYIHITMPVINSLSLSGSGAMITENSITASAIDVDISGSGSFTAQDTIFATSIDMDISGSGDMQLIANAASVSTGISGSGSITISGHGADISSDISGSGKLHTFYFYTQTAHVEMSGSGDMEINATDQIEGSISGSGDLYYKNAPVINMQFSGSGQLIHVD